jgi:transposase
LEQLGRAFSVQYDAAERPSVLPKRLLRATLLLLLYSIRLELQLVDNCEFDLLFRWFVGLAIDEAAPGVLRPC